MADCEQCAGEGEVCLECSTPASECSCDTNEFIDECMECDGTGREVE